MKNVDKEPRFIWKLAMAAAVFVALSVAFTTTASAQVMVSLVSFTNVWRYNCTGADLGTAWRTNDYDDSAWLAGPGLLQAGETTAYPVPFRTTLPGMNGRLTDYFRTWFVMEWAVTAGTVVYATNFVDDGCVLYLNGMEVGRVRMPSGTIAANSFATGGPSPEGQVDLLIFSGEHLRPGTNLLAVEVHQNSSTSADLVWGSRVVASVPVPLSITQQPKDYFGVIGDVVTLSVGVSGTPAWYTWYRDGVAIDGGGTNGTLSIAGATLGASGEYFAVVTNGLSRLTSQVARVLVHYDWLGPSLVSATVPEVGETNQIELLWNEPVFAGSVGVTNFVVRRLDGGGLIAVTNAVSSGRLVRLGVSGPGWRWYADCEVVITGVRDLRGNVVAPATRAPVQWAYWVQPIPVGRDWAFHNSALFDPGVYGEPWTSPSYVPGAFWGVGPGIFHRMSPNFVPCPEVGTRGTDVGFQPEPNLYRAGFDWPGARTTNALLVLRYLVDDGAVFYLNGREIHRVNQAAGLVTASSRAGDMVSSPGCVTNVFLEVSNLVAGVNVLAAAVTQAPDNGGDTVFGCVADLRYWEGPSLAAEPTPELTLESEAGASGWRLGWAAGGYILEASTNLADRLSYPFGPWIEVSNTANPFPIGPGSAPGPEPARFYRLKRK